MFTDLSEFVLGVSLVSSKDRPGDKHYT